MSVHYTENSDLNKNVSPLTKSETAWIEKFDALMSKMPSRLQVLEAADSVCIIDRNAAGSEDLHDGRAGDNGLVLADCNGATFKITSVSA